MRTGKLLPLLSLLTTPASAQPMMHALQTRDWAGAQAIAATNPDPLAEDLVTFVRLLQPGQASTAELDRFLTAHPDWPDQTLLTKRLEEALAQEPDPATTMRVCAARHIDAIPALLHCADIAGHEKGAVYARRAWVQGVTDVDGATEFLRRWSDVLTPEDDWQRFDRLAWGGDAAAAAQEVRLDGPHAAAAQAWLAFRRDDAQALILLDRVPLDLRAYPGLLLEEAKSLRRTGADEAAVALWRAVGGTAEQQTSSAHKAAFWAERDSLARKLLAAGQPGEARDVATDPAAAEQRPDSLFLSGWIALRQLKDFAAATQMFQALAQNGQSAISQGRAHYWLARTADAKGDAAGAHAEYMRAAAYGTTFYGQLAAAALHTAGGAGADPEWTPAQASAFENAVLPRAAKILCGWGDQPRARGFLLASVRTERAPAMFALAANLANGLGVPETAVQIARLAGRQGIMLPQSGWPIPVQPPPDHPALALGVIRQESSFDAAVVSPAGAMGLMQLRPGTAAETAARAGIGGGVNLFDKATNMRLGDAYLAKLLDQFGQIVPFALAAYNAGPHRVRTWQAGQADPATEAEMIDWIELIPFGETRNYVQRVIESATLYAPRLKVEFDAFAHLPGG